MKRDKERKNAFQRAMGVLIELEIPLRLAGRKIAYLYI